ncbi:SDR family oxidoreductase [Bacteroidota bacterium]
MNKTIKGKVVLITGASSGIGAAAALAFHKAGARVAVAARRREKLEQLAASMSDLLVLQVDVSDEAEARRMVQDTVDHFGRIDVLVNNAASMIVTSAEKVTRDDLLSAFRTNLLGPVTASQEAIIHMKKQGGGQIINVGSPGFMMGIPFYSPYVCSKAALCAWTRTIQAELADSEIIVSEYFPGYVLTDSKPESRVGDVEQDLLMSPKQNWLTRTFAKPKMPEDVAKQLVGLVRSPKTLIYSASSVRLGAFISNFSGFRLSLATQMARTARDKKPEI